MLALPRHSVSITSLRLGRGSETTGHELPTTAFCACQHELRCPLGRARRYLRMAATRARVPMHESASRRRRECKSGRGSCYRLLDFLKLRRNILSSLHADLVHCRHCKLKLMYILYNQQNCIGFRVVLIGSVTGHRTILHAALHLSERRVVWGR